jgi:hypothetical protein
MMSAMVTSGVASFSTKRAFPVHPGNRRLVARFLDETAAIRADGAKRVVVDFRTLDDGNLLVEQIRQLADDAALGLAAQAEQDQVVAREDGVRDLRHDRLVVAEYAGEQTLARAQFCDEVRAQFVFDGAHVIVLPLQLA